MSINLYGQAVTFILAAAIGFGLGIFYDTFRIFLKSVGDFIFWVVSLAVSFLLLLRINFAQMRFFIFLALALGFILYFNTLRYLVKKPLFAFKKYVKIRINHYYERRRASEPTKKAKIFFWR